MPAHCLPIVKGLGILSVGGLGLSLASDAHRTIPSLISALLYRNTEAVARATAFAKRAAGVALTLGPLAASLLSAAYISAGPAGKHPYLIYCSIGSVASLAWYCFENWSVISGLFECGGRSVLSIIYRLALPLIGKSGLSPELSRDILPLTLLSTEDEYVNVSHIGTSNTSDLSTLTPESSSNVSPKLGLVQEEANDALNRKESVLHLKQMRSASIISGSIATLSCFVGIVGLIGERC